MGKLSLRSLRYRFNNAILMTIDVDAARCL